VQTSIILTGNFIKCDSLGRRNWST